jgi:hypothetical protein
MSVSGFLAKDIPIAQVLGTGLFEIGFHVLHRETISNPNAKAMVELPSPDVARLQTTGAR